LSHAVAGAELGSGTFAGLKAQVLGTSAWIPSPAHFWLAEASETFLGSELIFPLLGLFSIRI